MASKTKKTKAPTGLKISRNGNSFTFSWKKGSGVKNHDDGQKFEYTLVTFMPITQVYHGVRHTIWAPKQLPWIELSVGKSTFEKTIKFDLDRHILSVKFHVKANENQKKDKRSWSDWSKVCTYDIKAPKDPVVSCAVDSNDYPKCAFGWSIAANDTDHHIFTDYEWDSILIRTGPTDGSQVSWKDNEYSKLSSGKGKAASYSWGVTEDTAKWNLAKGESYTRWFRIKAHGPGGWTGYKYAHHTYAMPDAIKTISANLIPKAGRGYTCNVKWNSTASTAHPIDRIVVQYAIIEPDSSHVDSNSRRSIKLSCPEGANWSSISPSADVSGYGSLPIHIPEDIPDNKCLFVRVSAEYDIYKGEDAVTSIPILVPKNANFYGTLSMPTGLTVIDFVEETNLYTIQVTNTASAIEESYLAVYYRTKSNPNVNKVVGIVEAGATTATFRLPPLPDGESRSIGVQARISDSYSPIEPLSTGVTYYTEQNVRMTSDIQWDGGAVPLPPSNVTPVKVDDSTIQVTWGWTWTDATAAELSWADHRDAWESTNEPSTYQINNTHAGRWNISGLAVGLWYVRMRLLKETENGTTYGTYSGIKECKLSSSPSLPSLYIPESERVISSTGHATCYWAYSSTDGTAQQHADVVEAFYDEQGNISYSGSPIASAGSSQHVTLYAEELGWKSGETHYVCVQVVSMSGERSEGWSTPVAINIAEELHPQITSTTLEAITKTHELEDPLQYSINANGHAVAEGTDEDVDAISETKFTINEVGHLLLDPDPDMLSDFSIVRASDNAGHLIIIDSSTTTTGNYLRRLPLEVTVEGAGVGGSTTVVIERYSSYSVDRPTSSDLDGFEGETIAMKSIEGEGTVSFDQNDLLGYLDDTAEYRIVANVTDSYGQTATTSVLPMGNDATSEFFTVAWEHQAIFPDAEFTVDPINLITLIRPTIPEGYEEYAKEDTCDIYRLSADRPELIVANAKFGTWYVDPYPTLGTIFGGHRIVYKTKYGDYITEDNAMAWLDLTSEDGNYLDYFSIIIDFEGEQISLPYNISVSNSWKKDFTTTKYLGGSVQGDWNPGVERTVSLNTVTVVPVDPDTIQQMRRLATYPGVCHVRTPDGSSFSANVDVQESREERQVNMLSKFTLDITRVDSEGFDGMTLAQWEGNDEDEE